MVQQLVTDTPAMDTTTTRLITLPALRDVATTTATSFLTVTRSITQLELALFLGGSDVALNSLGVTPLYTRASAPHVGGLPIRAYERILLSGCMNAPSALSSAWQKPRQKPRHSLSGAGTVPYSRRALACNFRR